MATRSASFLFPILLLFTALLAACERVPAPPAILPDTATATAASATTTPPTATPAPAPTVTAAEQIANLAALGRLYGLVRYFHPSDQVADFRRWDLLLMNGIVTVRHAPTPAELARQLQTLFAPVAPTLRLYFRAAGPPPPAVTIPETGESLSVTMWEHYGVQADGRQQLYTSERVFRTLEDGQIPAGFRDPRAVHVADLGRGVDAAVPVALYAAAGGTLPPASGAAGFLEPAGVYPPGTRYLAGAMMYWAVIRHFYPYLDVVDTDWDAALAEALTRIMAAEDPAGWEDALRWLLAEADDGHAILLGAETGRVPRLHVSWIEEQLVVLGDARPAADPLPPGTVILTIDGEDAQTRFARLLAGAPGATDQFRQVRATERMLLGGNATQAELLVRRPGGSQETISMPRDQWPPQVATDPLRPEPVTELAPGIIYVDLTRLEENAFQELLSELESATGIILDMRGGPGPAAFRLLPRLHADPLSTAQFLIPTTRLPNQAAVEWDDVSWTLEPLQPQLTANVVFLTDGRALSAAETVMGIIEHYRLGAIVGEPTAGTNGNINRIELPSGHVAVWTGMRVLKHDGSRHHGVGIQPTVPVSRTIAGIAAGRDEQLEAALSLLTGATGQ